MSREAATTAGSTTVVGSHPRSSARTQGYIGRRPRSHLPPDLRRGVTRRFGFRARFPDRIALGKRNLGRGGFFCIRGRGPGGDAKSGVPRPSRERSGGPRLARSQDRWGGLAVESLPRLSARWGTHRAPRRDPRSGPLAHPKRRTTSSDRRSREHHPRPEGEAVCPFRTSRCCSRSGRCSASSSVVNARLGGPLCRVPVGHSDHAARCVTASCVAARHRPGVSRRVPPWGLVQARPPLALAVPAGGGAAVSSSAGSFRCARYCRIASAERGAHQSNASTSSHSSDG